MTIESGPTYERVIRLGIVTLMCSIACFLFLRDGLVKYPRENAERARESFPVNPEELKDIPLPEFNPLVTKEAFRNVHKGMSLEELEGILGRPAFDNGVEAFWVGRAGHIRVTLDRAGRVLTSKRGYKRSLQDLRVQIGLGILAGLLALPALVVLIRALTTRVVLDDRGLTYNRRSTISWDQMCSLDNSRYRGKGRVALKFDRGGTPGEQILDSYHVGKFKEIVTEICRRKGFESPLTAEADTQPSADDATT